jgi:hypothetical protein
MIQTLMNPLKVKKSIYCHSGERGCVTIDKTAHSAVFVIPGLTRNPAFFPTITLLDAGSSPA